METVMQQLDRLEQHIAEEVKEDCSIHRDGCYYCGGNHPTDCCESQERNEFYAEMR